MISRNVAIIPLLLACAAPPGLAQDITLPQRLPPGRYVLLAVTSHSQVLTRNGTRQPTLSGMRTLELALDVQPSEPGENATVALSFRRIAQTLGTRRRMLSYDSALAKTQPSRLQHLLSPLLKARMRLSLTPAGRVAQAEGLNAIWDAQALRDTRMGKWLNQTKAEMGDEMLGDLLDQVGRLLPDKPVRVGGSWKGQIRVRLPYVGEKKKEYDVVLERIEKKGKRSVAVLNLGKKFVDDTASIVQVEPGPLTGERVEVTQTGHLRVGLKSLWPVGLRRERTSTLTMSGTDPTAGAVALVLTHKGAATLVIRPDTKPEPTRP